MIDSTDDAKGELTYHITGTKNSQTHDYAPVTISGFLTTKQELIASLTALKIDTTTVTVASKTKLASLVVNGDITLPTHTGFTFSQSHTATDSTGTLSVLVVGTSEADATVTRTETVSITGFHKLIGDPTAAVATLVAAANGTKVTVSDADPNDHMTAVVKDPISAGATTATITVSATGIYVFAGDTQTKDVSGVAVDQKAYTAEKALADAKTVAKIALNGAAKPVTLDLDAHSQTTFDAIGTTLNTQLGLVDSAPDVRAVETIAKGTVGTGITAINAAITAYNASTGAALVAAKMAAIAALEAANIFKTADPSKSQIAFNAIAVEVDKQKGLVNKATTVDAVKAIAEVGGAGTGIEAITKLVSSYTASSTDTGGGAPALAPVLAPVLPPKPLVSTSAGGTSGSGV